MAINRVELIDADSLVTLMRIHSPQDPWVTNAPSLADPVGAMDPNRRFVLVTTAERQASV